MAIDEKQMDTLLPLTEGHHHRFSILLLTQERCGVCQQAQDILERLSRGYWLSVSMLAMDSPEGQQLAIQGGLLFPPSILIGLEEDYTERKDDEHAKENTVVTHRGGPDQYAGWNRPGNCHS